MTPRIQDYQDILTIRYLTVAGVVVLLYDHLLTTTDEYQLIWKAAHSITKYAFLLNRYLVAVVMLVILHEMCGFNGYSYSHKGCQLLLAILIGTAAVSSITASILILQRVLDLWEDEKRMQIFLRSMYTASACVYISLTVVTIWRILPSTSWSPDLDICLIVNMPSSFPVLWGAPLFFEFSAILSVVYSTLATPRSSVVPIRRNLQKNGILFYLFVLSVRLTVVVMYMAARKSLSFVGLCFAWTSITTFFNHSFIRLCKAEMTRQELSVSYEETASYVKIQPTRGTSTHTEISSNSYRLRPIGSPVDVNPSSS